MTGYGYAYYEGPDSSVDDLAAFLFGHGHALRQSDAQELRALHQPHQIKAGCAVVVISPRDESLAADKELAQLVESAGLDFTFLFCPGGQPALDLARDRLSGEVRKLIVRGYDCDPETDVADPVMPPMPEERT